MYCIIPKPKGKGEVGDKSCQWGKTTRAIAKQVQMSLGTIGQILNKVTGGYGVEAKKQKPESESDYAEALKMFQDGQPLTDGAIGVNLLQVMY